MAGRSKDEIGTELRAAGWTEAEVGAALAGWMHQDGAGAVPCPIRSTAARDALFYALLFTVFGMVFGSTLALLFAQINLWLPEPDDVRPSGRLSGLRWSMAALMVFVPVFWLLDRQDRRATADDAARRHGTVRRWLSAIAMLIAALTLLGDALYLIYSWLDGQITPRFLVKAATVAVLALVVLAYFRDTRDLPLRMVRVPAAWVLTAFAVVVLALSFRVVGGPAQGQMEQRDRWRLSDLRTLANDVAVCPGINRTDLPESLDPLTCARNPARLTGYAGSITYARVSAVEFSLCTDLEYPSVVASYDLRVDGATVCLQQRTS